MMPTSSPTRASNSSDNAAACGLCGSRAHRRAAWRDRLLASAPPVERGPDCADAIFVDPISVKKPFRFRSRGSLIAATVLLQALVIGLGWFATMSVTRSDVEEKAQQRMMEESSRLAEDVSTRLQTEVDGTIVAGAASWEKAQRLIESLRLPGGAMVILLDDRGRLLCHPLARPDPTRTLDYSETVLKVWPRGDPATLGSLKPTQAVTGEADLLTGPTQLAVVHNETLGATVVVHQADAMVRAGVAAITRDMQRWAGIGALGVLLLTVVGSTLLVRKYDTMLMRVNRQLELEVDRRMRRGLAIRNGMIFGLAKLADHRDTDTGRHLERICRYSELLATEMLTQRGEIDRAWIERLRLASSMHDIGKVGIPDAILLKPGRLTPAEREVMETHTIIGTDTLIAIKSHVGDDDLLNMAIQVTLSHHERWDGSGYPHRLSHEQIPLAARIVALADMYDAVTSKRIYKLALGHEEARRLILSERGTHFDPAIVDAFERIEARFNEIRATLQPPDGEVEMPLRMNTVPRLAA
jgi:HD-GYP domain-containing protein (c-di-GMP phosphodiesterase class II)